MTNYCLDQSVQITASLPRHTRPLTHDRITLEDLTEETRENVRKYAHAILMTSGSCMCNSRAENVENLLVDFIGQTLLDQGLILMLGKAQTKRRNVQ